MERSGDVIFVTTLALGEFVRLVVMYQYAPPAKGLGFLIGLGSMYHITN